MSTRKLVGYEPNPCDPEPLPVYEDQFSAAPLQPAQAEPGAVTSNVAQPEQPEAGVLTDAHIEFALNCNLEDPSDDESSGFYAGARWAEAFLSTRKLSDEQRARVMEAVDRYASESQDAGAGYCDTKEEEARAEIERLLGGEA